jgi:tetratricopeptide (TPR) repeat protein
MAGLPGAEVAAILRAQPRPQDWKELEVRRWLEALELDVYAPTFEAAGVVGADLITMDAEALKRRLGVAHLGHRTKLLKEIAVLTARAMQHVRRGEEAKAKDLTMKRKEFLDSLYPDRVRRELKEKQDEKLLEARAAFWTPESDLRKTAKAVGGAGEKVVRVAKPGDAGGRVRGAPHGQHAADTLIITEGGAMANVRAPADGQHRMQVWGASPAQQRQVRPATGGRQRAPRGGAGRRQTAGGSRPDDREAPIPAWAEGDAEPGVEAEVFITPDARMEDVKKRIQELESKGDYGELIKAWVEYGACVRILHSDKDKQLVQTHFNLATNYLRQKLVMQALYHFKEADTVNQANASDADALFFKCRIMEGMGICETRLEHFKAAEGLLEQAKCLCMKKALGGKGMDEAALIKHIEEVDVEEIEDTDGAVASVLVAKSELYSAQMEYDKAVQCLFQAYTLKEAQLGSNHKQIGKLFSALGIIRQKQMKHKMELLQDVQATLESAVRIRKEIQDKTQGIVIKGLEEEKGLEQLLRDIANMQDKEAKLQAEVRLCKADVLDYMNRARKVSEHNRGEGDEETVRITKLVANLAEKFAQEESARVGRDILQTTDAEDEMSPSRKKSAEQVCACLASALRIHVRRKKKSFLGAQRCTRVARRVRKKE